MGGAAAAPGDYDGQIVEHTHCLAPSRRQSTSNAPLTPASYGRLLPDLPPFSADDAFLFALGRAGGLCDCNTDIDHDASLAHEAAGWPFFGQFVAHDITADRSTIRHGVDPRELRNARSPQLNLECLYGDDRLGIRFCSRVTIRRSCCSVRTAAMCSETPRVPR
jgi:hypothetical protein